MPEGDHMNIIDPPGLTVMRIAGGRYRVTGAVSNTLMIECCYFISLPLSYLPNCFRIHPASGGVAMDEQVFAV